MQKGIGFGRVFLFAAVLLSLGGCTTVGSTAGLLDAGYAFLVAVRDGNDAAAFDMCGPALQAQVGDATGLGAYVAPAGVRPARWQLQHWEMSKAGGSTTARMVGHATLSDGSSADVTIEMEQLNGDWRVTSFRAQ